jgi:hypothetical protein
MHSATSGPISQRRSAAHDVVLGIHLKEEIKLYCCSIADTQCHIHNLLQQAPDNTKNFLTSAELGGDYHRMRRSISNKHEWRLTTTELHHFNFSQEAQQHLKAAGP